MRVAGGPRKGERNSAKCRHRAAIFIVQLIFVIGDPNGMKAKLFDAISHAHTRSEFNWHVRKQLERLLDPPLTPLADICAAGKIASHLTLLQTPPTPTHSLLPPSLLEGALGLPWPSSVTFPPKGCYAATAEDDLGPPGCGCRWLQWPFGSASLVYFQLEMY